VEVPLRIRDLNRSSLQCRVDLEPKLRRDSQVLSRVSEPDEDGEVEARFAEPVEAHLWRRLLQDARRDRDDAGQNPPDVGRIASVTRDRRPRTASGSLAQTNEVLLQPADSRMTPPVQLDTQLSVSWVPPPFLLAAVGAKQRDLPRDHVGARNEFVIARIEGRPFVDVAKDEGPVDTPHLAAPKRLHFAGRRHKPKLPQTCVMKHEALIAGPGAQSDATRKSTAS